MKIGLVGFPGSGKTTVFNALTGLTAETGYGAARPGTKNLGVVRVPDVRVERLSALYHPKKTTFAEVTFCDIAGGTGARDLDRGVLNTMREMEALCQVIRAFENPSLATGPDALREIQDLQAETVIADLEIAEKRLQRLRKEHGSPHEVRLMERIVAHLEQEHGLRTLALDDGEKRLVSGYQFLTLKPLLMVLNVAEEAVTDPVPEALASAATNLDTGIVPLSAQVEMEIGQMPERERGEFYEAMGVEVPARTRFLAAAFELLQLITMLTAGPDECRAWPVHAGSAAPRAAGKIHSDIERGFIRAEVIRWEDLVGLGSEAHCREAGKLRVEGKEYIVQDGDVVHFRFNV